MEFLLAIVVAVILLGGQVGLSQEVERDYSTERSSVTNVRNQNTGSEK